MEKKLITDHAAQAASDLLWRTWQERARIAALPESLRPVTREEGYAIQARLEARSSQPLFGWKIAATSAAGQAHIGVGGPLAGRILAEMVLPEGSSVPLQGNLMRVAEPEFVFLLGTELSPRAEPYTDAEVRSAVDSLYLGIEVPDTRFVDYASAGSCQLIADNACAHRFALGPAAPTWWRDLDLSVHVVHCSVAGRYERDGIGANVLGAPTFALTWLVNELNHHGVTVRAGQYVTTGTCAAPLELEPNDTVTVDFGSLGSMSLSFV